MLGAIFQLNEKMNRIVVVVGKFETCDHYPAAALGSGVVRPQVPGLGRFWKLEKLQMKSGSPWD